MGRSSGDPCQLAQRERGDAAQRRTLPLRPLRGEGAEVLARYTIDPLVPARSQNLPRARRRRGARRLSVHKSARKAAEDRCRRKFPLGFRRHALRHYAASNWLRLGTAVHEVAKYLGDDPRTVLTVYAHVLGEGQRRDFAKRLATAERRSEKSVHSTYTTQRNLDQKRKKPDRGDSGIGL